jgi:2-dehydro-3-deoxyphosphogluconate aldolase/(4S)-4-hydroxy-2-oxoglutarate aldolase
MKTILHDIEMTGIVPVIAIDDAENAVPLAKALMDGGLPCAEVTFRTAAAKEAMMKIAEAYPQMLMGAGTVLTVDQVKTAVGCGAKFIVAPGLNPAVVEYCIANSIPVFPGVATPSEVERAMELGLNVVKFFPAEGNGGLPYLKAIGGPYKQMRFIPTGGIDETNLLSYLKYSQIVACGGSWMVKPEMIAAKRFDEIRTMTERAVLMMLGLELKHIGMNCADENEAMKNAQLIAALFALPMKEGNSSHFVGTQFEVMKKNYLGTHGHLAIGTNFIERAIVYFERKGYSFRQESNVEKNGKRVAIYLEQEVAGFAFHLLQV